MAEEETFDDVTLRVKRNPDVFVSIGGDDVLLIRSEVERGDGGSMAEDERAVGVQRRIGSEVEFPLLLDGLSRRDRRCTRLKRVAVRIQSKMDRNEMSSE